MPEMSPDETENHEYCPSGTTTIVTAKHMAAVGNHDRRERRATRTKIMDVATIQTTGPWAGSTCFRKEPSANDFTSRYQNSANAHPPRRNDHRAPNRLPKTNEIAAATTKRFEVVQIGRAQLLQVAL